jgi:8-oxo-dGTP diphosphatase
VTVDKGLRIVDTGYLWVAAGYLVQRDRVLLVSHRRLNSWVPPGGHVEVNETFAQAAEREFFEETGVPVKAVSATTKAYLGDSVSIPEPVPFYIDTELEGFARRAMVHFYFVCLVDELNEAHIRPAAREIEEVRWFDMNQVEELELLPQVKALSIFALNNHPQARA